MSRFKDSWGKAKMLLSQLLCIGAVFSACTDDEVINQTTKALQVSVSTESPSESRAIIDGGYLPDGASIGVTLTAEDGSAYDGQAFTNLQYTAAGEGSSQAWSSATPASLSITAGKVIAYYPYYGGDDFDLKAVPVETASQTDYMYAKPVTGINMVSPAANLTMQHAMTDIRINVKKGTYTGTGEVTKITAKAPAFAISATMDVETGVFANVSGGGAQFVQELTGAAISSGNVVHDFLIVPDAKSTSGEVSIFVIIDGKKFAVTVPYTEAFQQGFAYTYNLTLDNAELTLDAVSVSKWGVKAEVDESLKFYDDQYIVEIAVPSDGYEFTHNIGGFVGTIDWGDGTTSEYTSSTSVPFHTYTNAGNYTVTAEGKINYITSNSGNINGVYKTPTKIITKLVRIGKEMGVTSMDYAFQGYTLLAEIVPGALDGCANITSFHETFSGCTSLKAIPEGLFDKCTKVTTFYRAFYNCTSLTTISQGIFDKCIEVTSFSGAFYGCKNLTSIPEGLFDNCTKVTTFKETFCGCGITVIPVGLFDHCTEVTNFSFTFTSCEITKIQEGLFDNNRKVTDFSWTFRACSNLETIPEGLFDHCTEVTNFENVFNNTKITEIPDELFDKCTEVTSFEGAFQGCTALTEIPVGLFDKCTKVTNFADAFFSTAIISIPEGLFDNNTKVTNFEGTFYACKSLTSIPERLFDKCIEVTSFAETFMNCEKLQTMPVELFDYNTKVTTFYRTFYQSTLTGESPNTTINIDGVNTKIHLYERYLYPEYFTAPTSFSECFRRCTNLTDYSSIPSEWK